MEGPSDYLVVSFAMPCDMERLTIPYVPIPHAARRGGWRTQSLGSELHSNYNLRLTGA